MDYKKIKKLETPRLILRKLKDDDYIEAYKNWTSDPLVSQYVCWDKHENVEVTKKIFSNWIDLYSVKGNYLWGVETKETHDLIGTISIVKIHESDNYVEIGYVYGSSFWGKGYATEALKAVIKFCFEDLKVNLVAADHVEENIASGKVMKKSGMTYESTLKERYYSKVKNKYHDVCVYSITSDEYFNN